MGRCVRDLGFDVRSACPTRNCLGKLARPRFVLPHGLFHDLAETTVQAAMDEVVRKLQDAGAEIVEGTLPGGFADVVARHRTVMAVEAAQYHRIRLERHPEDYKPNIRQLLEEGISCPPAYYLETKAHQHTLQEQTQALLADGTILLTPATTSPAPDAATTGNPAFNSPWSYTGSPTVSFPTGQFVDGLPLAIQLVGGRDSEAALLTAGRWCERAAWD